MSDINEDIPRKFCKRWGSRSWAAWSVSPCDLRLWSYCWMQGLIPINVILNTRPIYWCISNHMQSLEKMGQKVKHHKAQWSINLLERSFKIILLDVIFLCRYFTWPQRAFYCLSLMAQATVLSWSAQNANAPWTLPKKGTKQSWVGDSHP